MSTAVILYLASIALCSYCAIDLRRIAKREYDRGWLAGVEYQRRISNRRGGSSR